MNKAISVKKIVLVMIIINVVSKGSGFLRELLLAALYGTSPVTDAYYIAISVPLILMGFVKSFSFVYTPIFVELSEKNEKTRAILYTKRIIQIIIVIAVIIIVISQVFMPQIITVFAPGYEGETLSYTIKFSRISIVLGLLSALIDLLSANLRCGNHFTSQALAGLIMSPVECVMIILGNCFDEKLLILGPIIGELVQLVIVIIYFLKFNYKNINNYKCIGNVKHEIKESFMLIVPIFISSIVSQINTFFDSMFGSMLKSGSVTSLNYAGKIFSMLFTLVFSTISTTLFPILSRLVVDDNKEKLRDKFSAIINVLIITAVPITLYSMYLSVDIVKCIYERGNFGANMTRITASSFSAYMIGITALGIQEVSNKLFYSLKKVSYSLIISIITVFMNLIGNVIFIKIWGQTGLAFASSLSLIITIPIIFYLIKKSVGGIPLKSIAFSTIKSIVACVAGMVICGVVTNVTKIDNSYFRVILTFCIAVPVYFVLMSFMKSKETIETVTLLTRRFKKK